MYQSPRSSTSSITARPERRNSTSTERIIKAFNTWAYKREQPSNYQRMAQLVETAECASGPIEFILYWGKGPRAVPSTPEDLCMRYLASMCARIDKEHTPGARLTLITTDTHARLNGHSDEGIHQYFGGIDVLARDFGFRTCQLSAIARPMSGYSCTELPDSEILQSLTRSAKRWYTGDLNPSEAARQYFAINMLEKRAVAAAFQGSIFMTFNSSKVRQLFPDSLPIFYMYSIKKGVAVKPWFMDADISVGTTPAQESC